MTTPKGFALIDVDAARKRLCSECASGRELHLFPWDGWWHDAATPCDADALLKAAAWAQAGEETTDASAD